MPVCAVLGAQWGDEGKGKIVDFLAQNADIIARFSGGNNAGHTVINDFGKSSLHLIPTGIFVPSALNVIGNGVVVNPDAFLEEALSGIEPTVSFQANRSVLSDMCQQAQEVCMGGRPLCPLCNQLVDPQGHVCPRTNGHHPKTAQELD